MKKTAMTFRKKRQIHAFIRAAIQLMFFIFFPSAFTAAFAGVKYLFTQIGGGNPVEWNSFVVMLCALLVYTVIFGRFFCGYACAFGSLGDAVRSAYVYLCKKLGKKPITMKEKWTRPLRLLKYGILLLIALLCFGGIYGRTAGSSPWDVFSMLRGGNLRLNGYGIGLAVLIVILAGMALCDRFFCRFLCPMGAVFSLMPIIPVFSVRRDTEKCARGCSACSKNCPVGCMLPEHDSWEVNGECIQCGKCTKQCPKSNAGILKMNSLGAETGFTLLRAAILAAVLFWAGA